MVGWNGCTGYVGMSQWERERDSGFHSGQQGVEIGKPIHSEKSYLDGLVRQLEAKQDINQ
jgi:hypothetical protein